ncbi:hypothetical protein [Lacinutrix jangbogonensis]|nr:hypothetical protein [Lacinutrix jangbogonensis]
MNINNTNSNNSSFLKIEKEGFMRIKRKYQRPISTIRYWESLTLSK